MRHLLVALMFVWLSLVVALRRLVRGPARPGWSFLFETVLETARRLLKRQAGRQDLGMGRARDFPGLVWSPVFRRTRVRPAEGCPVPAFWIEPRDGTAGRVIFYLHGGAYVSCSTSTHRELISRLALAAHARVLSVDYRLAPEHPFPAGLEDALAAWRWLVSTGADPAKTVIAGDSAGGGLSLATMLRLRAAGETLPHAAVLFSPWVHLEGAAESMVENATYDYLGGHDESMKLLVKMYAGDRQPSDPLISPLLADLRGLPPLLVQAGGAEILRDQIRDFAARARAAGVDARLEVLPDMVHVPQGFALVCRAGREAILRAGEFVRARLPASSQAA